MIEYDFIVVERLWEIVYFLIEKMGGELNDKIRVELDKKILELSKINY